MNYGTKMFFKNFFTICIVIVFSSSNLFAQRHLRGKLIKQDTWKNKKLEYVSDELCVFIKQGKTKKEVLELFSKFQGKLGREIDKDFLVIVFPDSTDIISIAKQLKDNPLLKAIEPNAVGRALLSPNDTYFQNGKQWALYNYGQNPPNGASGADIDIKKAWDLTSASKADMVAVLDSGIPIVNGNLSHEDLDDANRFILGNDYSGENDNSVKDKYGHGSHVLGILGAETNNNKGIAGVVYDGTFLIVQVFDEEGIGDAPGFYLGVKYAVDNGAKVINASVGYSYTGMSALEAAVIHAKNNNVIIAAAAGNDEIYDDMI